MVKKVSDQLDKGNRQVRKMEKELKIMLIKSQVKAPEMFSLMIIVFNLKDCHSRERMFSLCEPKGKKGWSQPACES